MGMYTLFRMDVVLRKDIPLREFRTLCAMVDGADAKKDIEPLALDHPLFETDCWWSMLNYTDITIEENDGKFGTARLMLHGRDNRWHLNICSEFKNYCGEIDKFVDWLSPWIDANEGDIVATAHHEEFDTARPIPLKRRKI